MDISKAMEVLQYAMQLGVKLAAPALLISLALGLLVAVFQAATQIHEQTLTFVPKLAGIAVALLLLGSWMIENLMDFMRYIFDMIANLG